MTYELPQLKNFEEAVTVLRLVVSGHTNGKAISASIKMGPRQGDYRLQATRLIGLIELVPKTHPRSYRATPLGMAYLAASQADQAAMRIQILLQCPPTAAALRILVGSGGFTTGEAAVEAFGRLPTTTPSRSTLEWRVNSFLKWLAEDGLLSRSGDNFSLTKMGKAAAAQLRVKGARGTVVGTPHRTRQANRRRLQDAVLRAKIENAAVEAATSWYCDAGRDVLSRESENLGWDLDVSGAGLPALKVEVKGTSLGNAVVELSPNEYKASQLYLVSYRVVVVTSALLENPTVREYHFDFGNGCWADLSGHILAHKELTSLRLFE